MWFNVVCTLIDSEYASSQWSKCCGLTRLYLFPFLNVESIHFFIWITLKQEIWNLKFFYDMFYDIFYEMFLYDTC